MKRYEYCQMDEEMVENPTGNYYSTEEVDERLAEKNARIAELEAQLSDTADRADKAIMGYAHKVETLEAQLAQALRDEQVAKQVAVEVGDERRVVRAQLAKAREALHSTERDGIKTLTTQRLVDAALAPHADHAAQPDEAPRLLRTVEWNLRVLGKNFCPMCRNTEADGHAPDCALGRYLAAHKEG